MKEGGGRWLMVDLLVLNYNDAETTASFVEHILGLKSVERVLIVDNASTDDSVQCLSSLVSDRVELVCNERNGGYGYGNNVGIRYLWENYRSKYILLANPDTYIEESAIEALESFLRSHEDYAIAAPFMLNPSGERQYNTAFRIPRPDEYIMSLGVLYSKYTSSFYYSGITEERSEFKQVGAVSGSLFMMNAPMMLEGGMYDESIFLYCEEIVLGLKLQRAGYKVALLPNESFTHNHSVSIKRTYKSALSRQRLLIRSKLYVIEEYFNIKGAKLALAKVLGRISLLEVGAASILRRVRFDET